MIISLVVIALALPSRWEGSRTGTDAYIPLRPLTTKEAVILFQEVSTVHKGHYFSDEFAQSSKAIITRLEDDRVFLLTRYYLIPEVGIGEAVRTVEYQGEKFSQISASWEGYYNLHCIDREELEKELGFTLKDEWVYTGPPNKVSFVSHHLWKYFLIEVIFLSFVLALTLYLLQKNKSILLIPPILALSCLITWVFVVGFYSPAFFDADWFYQRIFLESAALISFLFLLFLPSQLVIAGCLIVAILKWIARRISNIFPKLHPHRHSILGGLIVALLGAILIFSFIDYSEKSTYGLDLLHEIQSTLTTENIIELSEKVGSLEEKTVLRSTSDEENMLTSAQIDLFFSKKPERSRFTASILIPLEEEKFIFLYHTGIGNYADIRKIDSHNGSEIIRWVLYHSQPYSTSFVDYLIQKFLLPGPAQLYFATPYLGPKDQVIGIVKVLGY